MKKRKPIIAMDLSTSGKGGGPHTSTSRTINSGLKDKYDFKVINYRTDLGRGISIKRIKDIVNQINEIKPDIIHYTGLQLSGFHMAIACKLSGIKKTIVSVRGFSGDAMYFNKFKKLITKYILEPITLILAKKVIGVSEYVVSRKSIKFFASKKSIAIYNFPPKNENHKHDKSFREIMNINQKDILVVTVARIIKDKGYHIFDEAILEFNNNKNIKFLIVGGGDYLETMKEKLEKMAKNKQVYFLGYRNDIDFILKSCDIFVLPTLHETLSVALLEASNAGLALIASNTGGVPEIVENNHNGLLVTPGNVEELTNAIHEIYNNNTLRAKFAKNAKLKIKDKFSSEDIINKLDHVYESLLK
jgi:glycosyltransferase involved in cell wall biosynthesis